MMDNNRSDRANLDNTMGVVRSRATGSTTGFGRDASGDRPPSTSMETDLFAAAAARGRAAREARLSPSGGCADLAAACEMAAANLDEQHGAIVPPPRHINAVSGCSGISEITFNVPALYPGRVLYPTLGAVQTLGTVQDVIDENSELIEEKEQQADPKPRVSYGVPTGSGMATGTGVGTASTNMDNSSGRVGRMDSSSGRSEFDILGVVRARASGTANDFGTEAPTKPLKKSPNGIEEDEKESTKKSTVGSKVTPRTPTTNMGAAGAKPTGGMGAVGADDLAMACEMAAANLDLQHGAVAPPPAHVNTVSGCSGISDITFKIPVLHSGRVLYPTLSTVPDVEEESAPGKESASASLGRRDDFASQSSGRRKSDTSFGPDPAMEGSEETHFDIMNVVRSRASDANGIPVDLVGKKPAKKSEKGLTGDEEIEQLRPGKITVADNTRNEAADLLNIVAERAAAQSSGRGEASELAADILDEKLTAARITPQEVVVHRVAVPPPASSLPAPQKPMVPISDSSLPAPPAPMAAISDSSGASSVDTMSEEDKPEDDIAAEPELDTSTTQPELDTSMDEASGYGGNAEVRPVTEDDLVSFPDLEMGSDDGLGDDEWTSGDAKRQWRKRVLCSAAVVAVVVLGVALGVAFGSKDKAAAEQLSTAAPTALRTGSPSLAPSSPLDMLMEDFSETTRASLENNSTAQWKAWDWLENHKDFRRMAEWKKKQLFAIVTFFHAMGGEGWPEDIREKWLQPKKDECLWLSGTSRPDLDGGNGEESVYADIGTPCNSKEEIQTILLHDLDLSKQQSLPPQIALLTSLSALALPNNSINASFAAFLPSDFYKRTNLEYLDLQFNHLTGDLPSEIGLLTALTELQLSHNGLDGKIPSDLGLATGMSSLSLEFNELNGQIPSEMGMMTSMERLSLAVNRLTGSIPTELGQMTHVSSLHMSQNSLTGSIPSEFGVMQNQLLLSLEGNNLSGSIPSQLGMMTSMSQLDLQDNQLIGSIPSELAALADARKLLLNNNELSGTVPTEFAALAMNGSLEVLNLANNSLTGAIPEELCSMGLYDATFAVGLSFDCSDQLCGCCWCPCPESNYTGECQTNPINLSEDEWPGGFPSAPNALTINIRTDAYPEETTWDWSKQDDTGLWFVLDEERTIDANAINSYQKSVEPDSMYRLQLYDQYADGTCCGYGLGWFTITNYTQPSGDPKDSVLWEATGDALGKSMQVFIRVDSDGNSHHVMTQFEQR